MDKAIKIPPLEPAKGISSALGLLFLYNPAAMNKLVEQINQAAADTLKDATNAAQSARDAAASAGSSAEAAHGAWMSVEAAGQNAQIAVDAATAAQSARDSAQASDVSANAAMLEAQTAATDAAETLSKIRLNEDLLQKYVNDASVAADSASTDALAAKSSAASAASSAEAAAESAQQAASTGTVPATPTTLGGIKIGDTLQIDENNVANVSDEVMAAIEAKQGALTAGFGLQIKNGEISLQTGLDCGSTDTADVEPGLDCGFTE